jgi:hypothetical protein
MQTYKKNIKHVKQMKNVKHTKKNHFSKKNRNFICFKIRFYNSFKGDGSHKYGGVNKEEYNNNKDKLVEFLNEYLVNIKNDAKIYNYLNNILNYDDEFDIVNTIVTAIKKDIQGDIENKDIKENNTVSDDMATIRKPYDKEQLLEDIYKTLEMKDYFDKSDKLDDKTKEKTDEIKKEKYEKLTNYLREKETSQKIIKNIKNELNELLENKKITQNKYDSIIRQLDGISIISSSLATINKSANSFGKWLSPERLETDEDNSEKNNEQTIKFLWYPRKHTNYKKGNRESKNNSKDDKYGDFMIYIDSPKYADIGEYFKTSYNSVEDLFANILAGCDDMFCTRGNVKPTFYNSRLFIVKDKIIKDTKT